MPILDVYGEISPQSELILDITSKKFAPLVLELLPNGRAWDREDPLLVKLATAESIELSRVDVRIRDLERELNPATTYELLEDWETSYGLPDCAPPETIEGRRDALSAKLLSQPGHDHSFTWWSDLLDNFGYELHYVQLGPGIMTCDDDCQDVVNDEAFVWALALNHGPNDELVECFVSKNALLISYPVVHYLWEQELVPGFVSLRGVAGDSFGRVACVGLGGFAFYGSPNLNIWTASAGVPVGQDLKAVCAVDDILVAVGSSAVDALWSQDGGQQWISSALFAANTLNAISRGPGVDDVAVAVGLGGTIWRTSNAGQNFSNVASPTGVQLLGITACAGGMVAVGLSGMILRNTNNGLAPWTIIPVVGLNANIYGVSGAGPVVVLVAGGGRIYRSTDSGATWTQMVSPTASDLYCITSSTSGRWTAAGVGGVIVQSLDNGITWTQQTTTAGNSDLYGAGYYYTDGTAVLVGNLSTLIVE